MLIYINPKKIIKIVVSSSYKKFSLIVSNLKENIREKQLAEIFRQFPGFLNSRMTRYE